MSQPGYHRDLAYIHDVGFGGLAHHAATAIEDLLRKSGLDDGLVVELGCGSGIVTQGLCRAGYRVLGVDTSPAMLSIARRRAPQAQFLRQSFLAVQIPSCAAVVAVGECFNYLFDGRNSARQLRRLFQRIFAALQSGGLLVFDVAEPGRGAGAGAQQRFWHGDDWTVLVETTEDRRRNLLTRRITSFRKIGQRYRRDDELHHQRLLRGAELTQQLGTIGFRVRRLRGYGPRRFTRGHTGLVARKP